MRLLAVVFAALMLVAVPTVAGASPAYGDLQLLAKDMTFTTARLHPMQAKRSASPVMMVSSKSHPNSRGPPRSP